MARALSPIDESPVTSKPDAPYLLVREASKVRIRGPVKPRNESTTLMSMSMGRQSNCRVALHRDYLYLNLHKCKADKQCCLLFRNQPIQAQDQLQRPISYENVLGLPRNRDPS
ncbi:unnamed protein product [Fusarium graminearum]|uniref:Chromosome 2, complete genome n=1 Tax=Gibberella zeae (strain ATCC MYA-4620 / CBS 123657 / FGSC 9075 / NRRL 31084 / PH-1) TaxID=229533 RepID=I1S662_GIBZE|nr:hypothetical protein FGSG_12333 [Fusarium graminearum PH-1]ESU09162.1 hypothetical protein FGSG_12333 [Fusarium graminearum PH-1]CEF78911.1 unnamed protein product [Fusarium graminearum]CZS82203.1 unnamed protein product [Fusarium graminearum]|eukprot:XP_011321661.1 hypothetical protein FGSG_12333 [Fusarium graminearum PH-1]